MRFGRILITFMLAYGLVSTIKVAGTIYCCMDDPNMKQAVNEFESQAEKISIAKISSAFSGNITTRLGTQKSRLFFGI